ncbi:MAG: Tol-Pal system protein TolB [Chlamydiia bacterium]|nr:Tol-Pal system protein TolB [Chlamydiia bacterium]MCH9616303.1 Tol-Pal system protein TolB [Chlamydiia bacterium]MCH9629711.1 Tol-Pal system protein TolB [Chlamydiia bacterium]
MKKLFTLLFVTLLNFAFATELTVQLSTQNPLVPVYISKFENDAWDVLIKDLANGGRLKVLNTTHERETAIKNGFNVNFWKGEGSRFILDREENKFYLFNTEGRRAKRFISELTGNLEHDRKVAHNLADWIHKITFGEEGIASTKILYALQMPVPSKKGLEWKSEIYAIDPDGGGNQRLTHEESYCINPVKIPGDPEHYVYVNYKLGQPKLYISAFDEKKGVPFIALRGNQLLPNFSSNGRRIAFISDASGRADLFVQIYDPNRGPLGMPIQAYSFPHSVQACPALSPTGHQIAFVSDKADHTPRIYLINTPHYKTDNKLPKATLLTKKHRDNSGPSWSPDGRKLAYSARVDKIRQIMVYDFETGEEIQLTDGKYHKENPSWAPDSFHIVFNSVDPTNSELYIINLNQTKPRQITSGPGRKHYPCWSTR